MGTRRILHRWTEDILWEGEAETVREAVLAAVKAGANLRGADLCWACVVDLGQRSDGYQFYAQHREGEAPLIFAGCRHMPLPEARQHWLDTRKGTPLGDESQALLDHAERMVALRFPA